MADDPNSVVSSDSLGGISSGLNLSSATIQALTGNLSTAIGNVFKQLLPMVVSGVSNIIGYIGGVNRYSTSTFMSPLMGTSAFSAANANRAYSMGLLNSNAYMQNYGAALGFTGLPAQMSAYLSHMPGGMGGMQASLEAAYTTARSETGADPLYFMRKGAENDRYRAIKLTADDFLEQVNGGGENESEDAKNFRKKFFGDKKFSNAEEAFKALSGIDREKLNKREQQVYDDFIEGKSQLDRVIDGAVTPEEVFKERVAREGTADTHAIRLGELRTQLDELNKKIEKKGESPKLLAEREKLDAQIAETEENLNNARKGGTAQAGYNLRRARGWSSSERTFRFASLADMAIMNAAATDMDEAEAAMAGDTLTEQELASKQGTQNFITSAGGVENSQRIMRELVPTMSAESMQAGGEWFEEIKKGMQAVAGDREVTDQEVGDKLTDIWSKLGNVEDPKAQMMGMQELMALGQAGDGKIKQLGELYGHATLEAGGDINAAQDMVSMTAAMRGVKIGKMSEEDIQSSKNLITYASMTGGPESLAQTFEDVTKAMEALGVATKDVTGKQTRLAGALTEAAMRMRANIAQNGNMDARDAEGMAVKAVKDVTQSKAGITAGSIADIAESMGWKSEDIDSLLSDMGGMDPDEMIAYLRSKGHDDIADRYESKTQKERARGAARQAERLLSNPGYMQGHLQAALAENFDYHKLGGSSQDVLDSIKVDTPEMQKKADDILKAGAEEKDPEKQELRRQLANLNIDIDNMSDEDREVSRKWVMATDEQKAMIIKKSGAMMKDAAGNTMISEQMGAKETVDTFSNGLYRMQKDAEAGAGPSKPKQDANAAVGKDVDKGFDSKAAMELAKQTGESMKAIQKSVKSTKDFFDDIGNSAKTLGDSTKSAADKLEEFVKILVKATEAAKEAQSAFGPN